MFLIELIFWLSLGGIIYTYFGYPFILKLITTFKHHKHKNQVSSNSESPQVSLVIAARNEEKSIKEKIKNSLLLDYPKEKLEVIVVSDGSTDKTNQIVRKFKKQGVKLVFSSQHRGKSAAQNVGVAESSGDILVFSDATAIYRYDALRRLLRHFIDSRVGLVTGNCIEGKQISAGAKAYLKYEGFIREKESQIGNLAVAAGPIFAIRRNLFSVLDPTLSEDFVLPLKTLKFGYKVVYEPLAICTEEWGQLEHEFTMRKRLTSKDFRSLISMKGLLNPFKNTLISWGLISHKLLRWLIPFFLGLAFISNLLLLIVSQFFQYIFIFQVLFYLVALLGCSLEIKIRILRPLLIPCYLCLANLGIMVGIIQALLGKETGRWEPI